MKAISEIIIVIMILTVSVTLIGVAYVFLTNMHGQTVNAAEQSKEKALKTTGSCLDIVSFDDKTSNLWVKNCGKYNIENATVFVDGNFSSFSNVNLRPGELKRIPVFAALGSHEIKVVGEYASATSLFSVTNDWPGPYQENANSTLMSNEYLYVNYSKPKRASGNSLWQVRIGSSTANYSIPMDCWGYSSSKLIFRIYSYFWGEAQYSIECFNSSWKVLQGGSGYFGGGDAGAVANGNEAYDGYWDTWSIYSGFYSSLRTNETNPWTSEFRLYEEAMWWVE